MQRIVLDRADEYSPGSLREKRSAGIRCKLNKCSGQRVDKGMEQLQEFLLWCLLLNVVIYTFTAMAALLLRDFISKLQQRLFGVSQETVQKAVYAYLGAYKLLIIVFNFVPWLTLAVMR